MKTTKKTGGASRGANASSTGNLNPIGAEDVAKWWEERDTLLMPFINFYILVVRYQIHHGMSDDRLAIDLGRSNKTVPQWREAITVDSVLRELIGGIETRYGLGQEENWPTFMPRLKINLEIREAKIKALRLGIPPNRSDRGIPTGIFPLPVPDSQPEKDDGLLRPLEFAVMGEKRSPEGVKRLEALVSRLNWADTMGPPTDPSKARADLMKQLRVTGALHTQLSFMGEFFPQDSASEITRELALEIEELNRLAKGYFGAVILRACNEEQWWESISLSDLKADESFLNPPESFKTLDSLPEDAKKLAMETFKTIDVFTSTLHETRKNRQPHLVDACGLWEM